MLTVVAAACGLAVALGLGPLQDQMTLRALQSADPQRRCSAAATVGAGKPRALDYIAARLAGDQEPAAEVRASYVDALVRGARQRDARALDVVAQRDADGDLRRRAWLGLARLDPTAFAASAATLPAAPEPWDRVGLAAAWLITGDLRGIDDLFHWARAGDADLRRAACHALYHGVAPLLEAVGRWPADAQVAELDVWPAELVSEVEQRCRSLDLQALARQAQAHTAQAWPVRRNLARLTRAREIIARLIGAH